MKKYNDYRITFKSYFPEFVKRETNDVNRKSEDVNPKT
jgi:hypothetical protein